MARHVLYLPGMSQISDLDRALGCKWVSWRDAQVLIMRGEARDTGRRDGQGNVLIQLTSQVSK